MKKMLVLLMVALWLVPVTLAEEGKPESPVLMLKENSTTGYTWVWACSVDGVATVDQTYIPDAAAAEEGVMLVGAGGQAQITIHGLNPGEATLTFSYKRPWEEESLYTLVYHVRVDEDLNVTILSSRFDW